MAATQKTCSSMNHLDIQHKIKIITTNRPHKANDPPHRHPSILITLVDETSHCYYAESPFHTELASAVAVDNATCPPLSETPDTQHHGNKHLPGLLDRTDTCISDYEFISGHNQPAGPNSIPILISNAESCNIIKNGIYPPSCTKITPTCAPKTHWLRACLLNV